MPVTKCFDHSHFGNLDSLVPTLLKLQTCEGRLLRIPGLFYVSEPSAQCGVCRAFSLAATSKRSEK